MVQIRRAALALCLVSSVLSAGDYDALMSAIKKDWPGISSLAVVCDANASRVPLGDLTGAAGGFKVMVIDVKGPQDMGKAIATLSSHRPQAIILLAGDHVAGDGSSAASFLVQRMAAQKIPTAATTEAGVKQGAALGIGPGTGGKLLANAKFASVAGVAVPAGATVL